MSIKEIVLGAVVFVNSIQSAIAVEPHQMTASELLFACSSKHDSNDYPVCLVFMAGFAAGADATLSEQPWCKPVNLTAGEEILAVVRELRTYPTLTKLPLAQAVGAALVSAYPCRH